MLERGQNYSPRLGKTRYDLPLPKGLREHEHQRTSKVGNIELQTHGYCLRRYIFMPIDERMLESGRTASYHCNRHAKGHTDTKRIYNFGHTENGPHAA